jgi:hypothetical protein
MDVDRSSPATGGAEPLPPAKDSGEGGRQVVDWFGLTESNLPPKADEAPPADEAELQVPTLCSIGGLRP